MIERCGWELNANVPAASLTTLAQLPSSFWCAKNTGRRFAHSASDTLAVSPRVEGDHGKSPPPHAPVAASAPPAAQSNHRRRLNIPKSVHNSPPTLRLRSLV